MKKYRRYFVVRHGVVLNKALAILLHFRQNLKIFFFLKIGTETVPSNSEIVVCQSLV